MTAPAANALLMGGGVNAAKFETVGVTVGGRIVREPETKQQTDFDSGAPKFWPGSSDPMWQVVVQVQTDLRDAIDPMDDGVRAFYLKGQMMQAVKDAVKAVNAPGLEVGGELQVTFVREEPNSRGKGNPKKVYTCRYIKPTSQANNLLMGTSTPPVTTNQPAAIPQNSGAPAGIDPAVWAQLDQNQRATFMAASNASNPPF